ncbi:GGDEF domain-containing protein [Marinobacter sp. X15-166B]|uniref:GGDEF domain-containing protein n=1 Tax=Marinobacter sp. X15-166B TaxID=1897620 RepID=UPI00085CB607|nr:diguanylate cyclase [Marinobacter sp. X15-166B]OEY65143.1 diguanylate cyclase [Marinobacter sp. X15-166B]
MQSNQRRPQFWQVAMRGCVLAAAIDVGLFIIFYLLDSPLLAWINVVSVAMYIGAYYAFKYRRNKLAAALFWIEVTVHAAVGIVALGWDSGFHYYLLIFIPALCVTTSRVKAVAGLSLLWGCYVALLVLMWFIEPLQPISPTALKSVFLFNLTVVFGLFAYLSFFYLGLVARTQERLRRFAATDPLTGLLNRRHMTEQVEKAVSLAERRRCPLSFLLLDVDRFKAINDTYGHEVGDQVLRGVAGVLRQQLRKQDLIARWGGEEFLVALPDTGSDSAAVSGERLRRAIMATDWQALTGQPIQLTVSVGVSQLQPGESLSAGVRRSDAAMYRGKAQGRNAVVTVQA